MTGIYLLLGSNLGERRNNLITAGNMLEVGLGPVISHSSCYHTEAWGMNDAPSFINQLLVFGERLKPQEVLQMILGIEQGLGREQSNQYQNRTIDIDILYYGDRVFELPGLTIPHPRIQYRRFALEPLVEVAPDFVHPKMGKTNRQLLDLCNDQLTVKRLSE